MHAIYFSVNYQLKHIKMAMFQNHRKNIAFFYCNCVNIVDVLYVVILRKKSATQPSSVIFFNDKPATLSFLLSLQCGPPFTLVTKPRAPTMGLNLISVLIWSHQLIYDRS